MDRRTAVVLAVLVALMVAAGVGLLVVLRSIPISSTRGAGPDDLQTGYAEEVENRCEDLYERTPMGDPPGEPIESARFYLDAKDALPSMDEAGRERMENVLESWITDAPREPSRPGAPDFAEPAALVVEGARGRFGRSPYAFCAIDTDGEVLSQYSLLAMAVESEAQRDLMAGRDGDAAQKVAATIVMELDMARGGGSASHALAAIMVQGTVRRSLAQIIGRSRDAQAVTRLIEDLSAIEGSWIDLADNARIDGLVLETMFAACFMPEGFQSPVGPPVIEPKDQEAICNMGPLALSGLWKGSHERNMEIVEALGAKDPRERFRLLGEINARTQDASVMDRLLSPGRLFSDLAHMDMTGPLSSDLFSHTLVALARTAAAIRLHFISTGETLIPTQEQDWRILEEGLEPLVDPVSKTRPTVQMSGTILVVGCDADVAGQLHDRPTVEIPWSTPGPEPGVEEDPD